jgi:hypothetical protein
LKSSQSPRRVTKTIYQVDLVTAQRVKTLGRRNAKPTATERSWKNTSNMSTHQSTTNATNRERSRRDTGDGDAEEAAGQCEGCMRDILWD